MGGGRSNSSSSSSSSGEEDGDAEWKAAIDSVATTTATFNEPNSNGLPDAIGEKHKPQFKRYQIKGQKLLDELIEKNLEWVTDTAPVLEKDPVEDGGGIRLFKTAPPGIKFDHVDELQGPKKKPKLLPGEELDEKSKKFRKQLQSVAVDGADIITAARTSSQKSLAKLEAREAAAKAAAKKEEERVAELKKIRGERWLPSIAREIARDNRLKLSSGYAKEAR
ncbi:hypothetical protein ACJIZ3_014960 [Penstemon smallii]|uniref:Uncharacterized protein n=1 Tax=Penstemon smallii TaxID=265156 RepID=A0ABD3RL47_9LAMI